MCTRPFTIRVPCNPYEEHMLGYRSMKEVQVPCGKCPECLIERQKDISVRAYREAYNYGTISQYIYAGLDQYLNDELDGSDYSWTIGNVTISAEEYSYLMDLAEDNLDNTESNIGYGLAEVVVMPACP